MTSGDIHYTPLSAQTIREIYGKSRVAEIAAEKDIPVIGRIPVNPTLAAGCDQGLIELFDGDWLNDVFGCIEKLMPEE